MRVVSVNVSLPKAVLAGGREVRTGIFKEPAGGRVAVRRLNLAGDAQADLSVHGGLNKAVYAYPAEHYPAWQAETGRAFPFGRFGENLTTEGLLEDEVRIGDVFRFGTAVLEVAQPRMPCFKLAIRMNDPGFPKRFMKSGRTGFYLRVVEEGDVAAGDGIGVVSRADGNLTVRGLWHLCYFDGGNADLARDVLARYTTLGPEWRRPLEFRVSSL
ncbi:MAG: MOSC domain-containing protein [Gemmataceae bacterium]|nr:MOSC domain-containing protein [Gemmataceae bacterium]